MTGGGLDHLRQQALGCRNCDLWEAATAVVMGQGPAPARMMLVGEQPGDQEDRAGRPFVGRPDASSTRRWSRPAWSARRSTSPTR